MAEIASETTQYAIYVIRSGWLKGVGGPPFTASVGPGEPTMFSDHDAAIVRADALAADYRRLGQSQLVDLIRIVERTVTLTQPDWEDVAADMLSMDTRAAV